MGICYWDARMLWEARQRGNSFDDTLTVGHQFLYLHPQETRAFQNEFQSSFPGITVKTFDDYNFGDFSDAFLTDFLGVSKLSVLDISAYEGADMVHDLNEPVPAKFHARFDAVIDSGSLEHIFNFPVAIANLMRMLKVGGSIFITTPANNLCGHGFYQFSPELMFRIFTKENGFELQRLVLFESAYPSIELVPSRNAYEVTDPEDVKSRVGILSNGPVTMMVEAKKLDDVPLFAAAPLQSDYVEMWREGDEQESTGLIGILKGIKRNLPHFLKIRASGYVEKKRFSFSNKRFYKKL